MIGLELLVFKLGLILGLGLCSYSRLNVRCGMAGIEGR